MKKLILISLLIQLVLVPYVTISAQPYFNDIYRTDTAQRGIIFRSIITSDTAWYITGLVGIQQPYLHNGGLFVRMDMSGNIQQYKIYDDTLQTMEMWYDTLIPTNDGHFAAAGYVYNNWYDAFLAVFDANGDTLLYKTYKGADSNSSTFNTVTQIRQDKDSNYYLLARAGVVYKSDSIRTMVIKTDSLGNENNRFVFPSPDSYCPYGEASDLQLLPNGHFIISAAIRGPCPFYYNELPSDSCRKRTWIFEADTTGLILWQYLSPADRRINAPKITLTHDGGVVFSGYESFLFNSNPTSDWSQISSHQRQYIGKIDSNHDLVWEYTNPAEGPSSFSFFSRSVELANGSILVCGNHAKYYHYDNQDSVKLVGYLVKFSAAGNRLGSQEYTRLREINPSYPQYDLATHYFQDMVMLPDSSLVMVGEIVVNWIPSPIGGYWGWVVHTDKDGCVEQEACFPLGIEASPLPPPKEGEFGGVAIKVYPNPASEYVTFSYQIPPQAVGGTMLLVSDVSGKEVSRLSFKDLNGELLWDTRSIPEGLYYYTVLFGTEQLASGSLSIVHK